VQRIVKFGEIQITALTSANKLNILLCLTPLIFILFESYRIFKMRKLSYFCSILYVNCVYTVLLLIAFTALIVVDIVGASRGLCPQFTEKLTHISYLFCL